MASLLADSLEAATAPGEAASGPVEEEGDIPSSQDARCWETKRWPWQEEVEGQGHQMACQVNF